MSTQRIVMITGVSRGLGQSMARKLAQLGHTVVGCARSADAIDGLNRELGTPHYFSVVDVCDSEQVSQWVDSVCETTGVPDLLLNNAAIINPSLELWKVAPEDFSQVIDVNIKGVFHVIRALVPKMIEEKKGVVVNFSSGWGRSTSPEVAPYCATKWAIEGMTKALADELPRPLAAVALNPGIIHTEMLASCFGEGAASFVDPETWAETAVPYVLALSSKDNGASLSAPG